MVIQMITGLLLGVIISLIAWRAGSLSDSGAIGAALTGGLVFGIGGLPWGILLMTFFLTSSGLSKLFRNQKLKLSEKFSKGSRRDWGQVLANGGLGSLLALVSLFHPHQDWIWFAYAGAMAAVNADTWATELGVLNPKPPRLITTRKPVEPGTSGGISPYGMLSSLAGAALIGVAGMFFLHPSEMWGFWLAATLGGVGGSLFDSFLGATVQAIYHCPKCEKETERHPAHSCNTRTHKIRGWDWLNNDLVNFLASLLGAGIAAGIWFLFLGD